MEEFKVRLAPKVVGKKLSVFRMHKDDHVPWAEAKMKRDNEYQPWQIKAGSGKTSKRFKASKVGSVDENSDFFVFYKPKGSTSSFEVCPIDEWYNVAADKRYKTLTAEEAEEQYLQRHKNLNLDNLMRSMNKNSDNGEEGSSAGGGSRSFKISEMDDWQGSDDDFSGSENGEGDGDGLGAKKKSRKKSVKKEKDDPDEVPEEGKEDSDEGDFEQREVDYMSETSSESSQSEKGDRDATDVKGIDEEQALRDLLDSEEEDEDAEGSPEKGTKLPSVKNPSEIKRDPDGNGSEDSSDNDDDDDDDYDVDEDEMDSMFMKKSLPASLINSASSSLKQEMKPKQEPVSASSAAGQSSSSSQKGPANAQQGPTANKRKLAESVVATAGASTSAPQPPQKRHCPPEYSSSSLPNSIERTIEDLIKKYLRRKPTTLKTLLRDIKSKLKRMGGTDLELKGRIHSIADIIKKLNPEKQKLNDETYLFLKS